MIFGKFVNLLCKKYNCKLLFVVVDIYWFVVIK